MKIIQAEHSGFCYGVDNAIKIANKTILENTKRAIYMLGELVHNEEVVKKIKKQGIKFASNIKAIPDKSLVILSAHGHSPIVYEEAKKKNLQIIDATCPMVTKVHVLGKILANKNFFTVIIGDKKHSEVKAIFDQVKSATDKVKVIESVEQAKKIGKLPKIGIISQTTQSVEQFSEIVAEIAKHSDDIQIFNTICDATRFRQSSAKELAQKVDLMIVIGSFHSANTKRLTSLCAENIETHQVNSSEELEKKWFKNKKTIGITAGASTPDWVITDVIGKIKNVV